MFAQEFCFNNFKRYSIKTNTFHYNSLLPLQRTAATWMSVKVPYGTLGRRQSKTLILSTDVDQKSLETEFSIAICRQSENKWQSKTLFPAIYDPRSSIFKSVFDCRLPGVKMQKKSPLTLCNLMDFPIQKNVIRMGLSIIIFKWS